MRILSRLPLLLLAFASVAGCSQSWSLRQPPSDMKTVASVGDRPLPVRSGTPDSSVRSGVQEPIITSSTGRISGRVFDEQGKPVQDARVRLAMGSEPGGKALLATTDRSGAFTLRGLRPGSSYTVIADYQGRSGPMTGRAEAEAPESNVRIGLHRRNVPKDEQRASIRPARPNIAPASRVDEAEESEEDDASSRFNREDIDPPAPEADTFKNAQDEEDQPKASGSGARGIPGWTNGSSSSGIRSGSRKAKAPRVPESDSEGSDEQNPLPPAIESGRVGSLDDPAPETGEPVRLARAGADEAQPRVRSSGAGRNVSSADDSAPEPLPGSVIAGARSVSPPKYGPMQVGDTGEVVQESDLPPPPRKARKELPPRPSRGSRAPANSDRPRPTWGELSFMKPTVPLDESLLRVANPAGARPLASAGDRPAAPAPAPNTSAAPQPLTAALTGPMCKFDPAERRLDDFALPDVQGRLVSFRDLDADLILLDFWGTWCAPCQKSVTHLVEIQQKLGGKKMQVIGIACEKTSPKERSEKVAQAMKKLGINYPVLISGMDGNCPVQDAFQVQFYPTLVLLDRQGKILWREQGATEVTLARMDRFIARNLNLGGTPVSESPAEVARAGK